MSTVYFITHPDITIDPDIPITEWSLSDRGLSRMNQLLSRDWVNSIEYIYSSSEKKALDGAMLLGDHLRLPCTEIEALGENDRSSTGYLKSDEFESVADQFFAQPNKSVRAWETADDAQSRIVLAVNEILEQNEGNGSIAIVSHGAVGTLLLCHLNHWDISREYDQPGTGGGNYFSFDSRSREVHHAWLAIDA